VHACESEISDVRSVATFHQQNDIG